MKKLLLFLLALWQVLFLHAQQGGGQVSARIDQLRTTGIRFERVALFERLAPEPTRTALWSAACTRADVLRPVAGVAQAFRQDPTPYITLELPSGDGLLLLDLERVDITAAGFRVVEAASDSEVPYAMGQHYRGSIRGVPGSLAAISIFDEEVMGLMADEQGQIVLGRFENNDEGLHVLYRDTDLRATSGAVCGTVDEGPPYSPDQLRIEGVPKTMRCVRFYWEVAYDIHQNKGGVTGATNYVTGLFNQSATLFANDGIDVTLQEVFVWNVQSPFNGSTSSARLTQFGDVRTSFNGDLAHLLDYGGMGGVAWLNTLCNGQTRYRMAYSGINSSYQNVPTYSWSVEVVTHEQGHNMGSRHTHACVWNGNNTAIDGCGPAAGYSEGSCPQGPLPPTSVGGTIMSYCHLTSSTIKFANGFGPQPTALIVNRVNTSACLPTSCGTSCDPPGGLIAGSITTSTALLSWGAVGATSYTLRWRLSPAGTWTTVNGLTDNTYSLTALDQGTAYDVQVYSVCGATSSAWSSTYTFTTAVPCPDALEPNNTLAGAADIFQPASFNATIASSSDADYYRFVVGTTSTVSISLSNLPGDYDIRLLNASGVQLAISQAGGTSSESITYANAAPGNYYIHVYGWNGAFSTVQCYLLSLSTATVQNCGVPGGLAASAITWNAATLDWNNVGPANSYSLRHRPQGGGDWSLITGIAGTSRVLTDLVAATTYEVRVMSVCNGGGSPWSAEHLFTTAALPCDLAPTTVLAAKVLLDGPYRSASGLMVDSLRTLGLLPLTEPYSLMGFDLTGPGLMNASVLTVIGPNAIVDWVVVELRDALIPAQVLEARAALLQRDGDVVAVDGASPLGFCLPAGNYHIAVRHRNHLGCMTAFPIALGATVSLVDLTLPTTPAYGTDARKAIGAVMALWAGNVVVDDMVKYTGSANDRDDILNVVGGSLPTQTLAGYHLADVNLDGLVKYTGMDNDRDIILNNIGGNLPTNTRVEQVP